MFGAYLNAKRRHQTNQMNKDKKKNKKKKNRINKEWKRTKTGLLKFNVNSVVYFLPLFLLLVRFLFLLYLSHFLHLIIIFVVNRKGRTKNPHKYIPYSYVYCICMYSIWYTYYLYIFILRIKYKPHKHSLTI